MWKAVFCDLETSGLKAKENQVLEVAMVTFKEGVIDEKNSLHFYLNHKNITFNFDALVKFGDRVRDRVPGVRVASDPTEAASWIRQFLIYQAGGSPGSGTKITFGGKNFASFDLPFLMDVCPWLYDFTKHRAIDLGNLYLDRQDYVMPDLSMCRERALKSGVTISREVTHTALDDAIVTAELYKGWWDGKLGTVLNPAWRAV